MKTPDLAALAQNGRLKREAGIALILGAIILGGLYVLLPKAHRAPIAEQTAPSAASSTPNAYANLHLRAKAAIVYDLATHKVLFAKNPNAQLPLASVTKLLTTYTAVKELGLNAPVTITLHDIETEGDSGFHPGEVFSLKNLARYTLVGSINDGAAAMAATTAARASTTIHAALAASAASLGLTQTYAIDGSGLDMSKTISGGYGSPHDIAILAGALLKEAPTVASATTHLTSTLTSTNFNIVHHDRNTNQTVATTPRILLSKTGYTDLADGNLVVVFDAAFNHPIAVVALGSTEKKRFTDVRAMINATLAHFAGVAQL